MCDYCEKEKEILRQDAIGNMVYWMVGTVLKEDHISEYPLGVFIDRGYLRMVDLDDCQCLDHGGKIKINYCPFCGDNLSVVK